VYSAGKTIADPNASAGDKLLAGGGVGAGLFLPGPGTAYTKGAAKLTKWGWEGSAKHRSALRELAAEANEAITHTDVGGIIPTRVEAERLIYQAGGKIERIQKAHPPGKGHTFPHINYTTAGGTKATVRVESVSREFIREK
jgi:hypothetical protein